jgi:hypothetical protein
MDDSTLLGVGIASSGNDNHISDEIAWDLIRDSGEISLNCFLDTQTHEKIDSGSGCDGIDPTDVGTLEFLQRF